jgi:hypothetical protein
MIILVPEESVEDNPRSSMNSVILSATSTVSLARLCLEAILKFARAHISPMSANSCRLMIRREQAIL